MYKQVNRDLVLLRGVEDTAALKQRCDELDKLLRDYMEKNLGRFVVSPRLSNRRRLGRAIHAEMTGRLQRGPMTGPGKFPDYYIRIIQRTYYPVTDNYGAASGLNPEEWKDLWLFISSAQHKDHTCISCIDSP